MAVGRKYGVAAEAIAMDRNILDRMPIWYHKFSEGDRRLFNSPAHVIKCLKEKHHLKWVGDTRALAYKAGTRRHTNCIDCHCTACQLTRAITGCNHPNQCYHKAQEMINSLEDKWDPSIPQPEDLEHLRQPADQGDEEDTVEFDPRVTTRGTLADVFRIFTDGNE
ncbi:hypothetical protein R3P38DRAFT_2543738, partial [Favolaschia claudopus]